MSNIWTFNHGTNPSTSFTINKCGATVTSWKVNGEELLFLSSKAVLNGSKAIRGGIPLCFPQFGPWSDGRPQHGFARNSNKWEMKSQQRMENGDVTVTMVLTESEDTLSLWKHPFVFSFTITLSANHLHLNADVQNTGTEDFDVTFCFHTYFRVKDSTASKVKGLKSLTYVDKTKAGLPRVVEDESEVTFSGFLDRVYEDASDQIEFLPNGNNTRKIILEKTNLRDMVVWNPWKQNCEKMSDMDDDGYKYMVCVEAAQTSQRAYVKAGGSWSANHVLKLVDNSLQSSL